MDATQTPRIPVVADADLAPADVVSAIRQRRGGGLLNLDRMLLNSPAYAQAARAGHLHGGGADAR